jgi:1,4-alpha-glucan branching enzyme
MPQGNRTAERITEPTRRVLEGRHHDPFEVLGKHLEGDQAVIRALLPRAGRVRIVENAVELERIEGTDLFVWRGPAAQVPERYRLHWYDPQGNIHHRHDP